MRTGDLVIAARGRTQGLFFAVEVGEGFAYIADGKTRKAGSPKKKSLKHLKCTGLCSDEVSLRIKSGGNAIDALMRSELKRLKEMLQ